MSRNVIWQTGRRITLPVQVVRDDGRDLGIRCDLLG